MAHGFGFMLDRLMPGMSCPFVPVIAERAPRRQPAETQRLYDFVWWRCATPSAPGPATSASLSLRRPSASASSTRAGPAGAGGHGGAGQGEVSRRRPHVDAGFAGRGACAGPPPRGLRDT